MSKLSVTFQFDSEAEAQDFLNRINPIVRPAGLPVEVTVEKRATAPKAPKAAKEPAAPAPPADTASAASGAAAPAPKAAKETVGPTPPVGTASAASVAVPPTPKVNPAVGVDDIRTALRTVFNGKGATAATQILKDFGATSVSSVKPEQYAAFIKACS